MDALNLIPQDYGFAMKIRAISTIVFGIVLVILGLFLSFIASTTTFLIISLIGLFLIIAGFLTFRIYREYS